MRIQVMLQVFADDGALIAQQEVLGFPMVYNPTMTQPAAPGPAQLVLPGVLPIATPVKRRGRPKKPLQFPAAPMPGDVPAEIARGTATKVHENEAPAMPFMEPVVPSPIVLAPPAPQYTQRDIADAVTNLSRVKGLPVAALLVKSINVAPDGEPEKLAVRVGDIPMALYPSVMAQIAQKLAEV